jgi:hypothetical protein
MVEKVVENLRNALVPRGSEGIELLHAIPSGGERDGSETRVRTTSAGSPGLVAAAG